MKQRRTSCLLRALLLVFALSFFSCDSAAESRVKIAVEINDQPMSFILDTGSERNVLFRHAAARLKLELTHPPAEFAIQPGQTRVSRSEPVKIAFLGRTFNGVSLAVADDPPGPMHNLDGVIGWSAVFDNVVLFRGTDLHVRLAPTVPPESTRWPAFPAHPDTTLTLALPKDRNGVAAFLAIDTGSAHGVHLAPNLWKKLRARHQGRPSTLHAYFTPGAGLIVTEELWSDRIDLGGLKLHGVPVAPMNSAESHLSPPGTVAVLGLQAMRRLDLVYDGTRAVAYIRPRKGAPPPYSHNRIGAVFSPPGPDDDRLIARVLRDSPAARAGIRDGDVLMKIDELDVTRWRTEPGILPLSRFWDQSPGTILRLTLKRAGKTLVAKVVLVNLLGPPPVRTADR